MNRERTEAKLTRRWYFNRYGVDESPHIDVSASVDGKPVEAEIVQQPEPKVVTQYDGNQPRIIFTGGVDFSKGGSIPF